MYIRGGGHGKKTWSTKGATGNFPAFAGGQDEIMSESTQNHQPPLLIKMNGPLVAHLL
jgi:hypothetical protein